MRVLYCGARMNMTRPALDVNACVSHIVADMTRPALDVNTCVSFIVRFIVAPRPAMLLLRRSGSGGGAVNGLDG